MGIKKYTCQRINSKPVLLFLSWLFLLGLDNALLLSSNLGSSRSKLIFANFNNLQFILYPLLGILMDVWSLRLKMMKLCAFATIPGLLIDLVSKVVLFTCDSHHYTILKWTVIVLFTIPFSLFRANIIPTYMDQIMGSSSDEHSAVVYWHTFVLVFPVVVAQVITTLIIDSSHLLVIQITVFVVTLYILPCSYSNVPKRTYESYPHLTNPVKVVYKVLGYAFRKKNNQFRSALTFWEEECPSKIDLGKEKYGGPFKEGDVEDVKTALRMFPILMCTMGHLSVIRTDNFALSAFTDFFSDIFHFDLQFLPANLTLYGTILVLIIAHQLVFKTLCLPLVPTMLTRIGFGLFFALMSTVVNTLLAYLLSVDNNYYECIHTANETSAYPPGMALLYLMPLISNGVSYFMIVTASLEFTVAQSPVHMRSLLIGLWYMFWGIGTMVEVNLNHFLQCQLTYFAIMAILNLAVLIMFVIAAKNYKLRVKNSIYDAYNVIEDKVIKNIQHSHWSSIETCT